MVLFAILSVVAIVCMIAFVIAAALGGSIFVILFGDAIVCVAIFVLIIKLIRHFIRN